jgi:broad specificity phosphatase PhoE
MRHIWFVRHAESESNANLITIHPAESALTDRGWRQAHEIAAYFDRPPQLVACSPYLRARQTARPTIERFAPVEVVQWPVQEFTYLAPQRYYNTTGEERRQPTREFIEREDPHFKDAGSGESFAELVERLRETEARMIDLEVPFTIIFTHGWFMRALLWYLLEEAPLPSRDTFRRFVSFSRGIMTPNGIVAKFGLHDEQRPRLYGYERATLGSKPP